MTNAELLKLLDLAATTGADVDLHEHRTPGAEYALRLWAGARNDQVAVRVLPPMDGVREEAREMLEVLPNGPTGNHLCVFRRAA